MRAIGVDPGLSGAIAAWNGKRLEIVDVPIMKGKSRGNEVNIPALVDMIKTIALVRIDVIYVERNPVRPKEGLSSARKNGEVVGILLGALAMCTPNVFRPTPNEWKKVMGLNKDKEFSRTKAITTFPDQAQLFSRKKDHNRAEAALLAMYGLQEYRKRRGRPSLKDIGL